ncbi:type II toxin-antitoxin system YhaV family toxin [Anabaena sp. UHCC 0187]|uniref:type II toxin-antitoxin system YhaV family toxin n=1 Tax=Anabaena sp. UHCC 0187 TaxID=2590018 RepID=UPI00144703F4|nr:type II toxin-antitoxin system YhaV family toxin [Anabaena sp. UHCC 0187]MDP5016399.1 type II toxin-antitoxin system YhaV family toxin [Dolichospermum sp.]MTJ14919.1 type II toxin-antitoxin system YhaV family toxin [Anabaena sp. UHCC 0187]
MSKSQPPVINGWNIFAHSLFLEQFEELFTQVEILRQKDPQNYHRKNATKRLAAIAKLAFAVIPEDPTREEYRQGITLGNDYKHWFRAKFFQQYRLFFRYHQESKIIVFVWVNDENSKRVYGSKTDAYRVFKKMLENDHPPDDWDVLLTAAKAESNRLEKVVNIEI